MALKDGVISGMRPDKRQGDMNRAVGTPLKPKLPGGDRTLMAGESRMQGMYDQAGKTSGGSMYAGAAANQGLLANPNPPQVMPAPQVRSPIASQGVTTAAAANPAMDAEVARLRKEGMAMQSLSERIPGIIGSSTPDPMDVQAAKQREYARGLGGVSMSNAEAIAMGRRDASAAIAQAGKNRTPATDNAIGGYSPLAGDAANFRRMSENAAASSAASDAEYKAKYDSYREKRDLDENGNGVPDRDEAVASKYSTVGINNVNDLSKMSGKYTNYMKAYRNSAARDESRAMTFDEFAKAEQEAYKSRPVYGLNQTPSQSTQAAQSTQGQPAQAASPMSNWRADARAARDTENQERAERLAPLQARALEQRIVQQAMVGAMNSGYSREQAAEIGRAALASRKMAEQQQLARNDVMSLEQAKQNAETERAKYATDTAAGERRFATETNSADRRFATETNSADRRFATEESQRQYAERASLAQQQYELTKARIDQEADAGARAEKRANLEMAMRSPDPISERERVYSTVLDSQLAMGMMPTSAKRIAESQANAAYSNAESQRQLLRDYGIDMPDTPAMPEGFVYNPTVDADLAASVERATPEQIVQLYQQQVAQNGEEPTLERLREIARSNGFMIDDEAMDNFANVAVDDRGSGYVVGTGGDEWFSPIPEGSNEVYKKLTGDIAVSPGLPRLFYTQPHRIEKPKPLSPLMSAAPAMPPVVPRERPF